MGRIIADVRVSERLEGVVVTPRQYHETHQLMIWLAESLHPIRVHRHADGAWLTAFDVDALFQVPAEVDLRWNVDARRFAENRLRVKRIHSDIRSQVERITAADPEAIRPQLAGSLGVDQLDSHQRINVAAMTLPESFGLCVFDEQGAGKTVTLIFAFDLLVARDLADFALIVAPKSMVSEWPADFFKFKKDLYSVATVTGSRRNKRLTISSRPDVLVTNFETAVAMEDEFRSVLRQRMDRSILVVDESFYAKNLDAQRTRSIRRLREWCGRAFVLCGTPAPNTAEDLVQQFNIVDFGFTFSGTSIPKDPLKKQTTIQTAIKAQGIYVRHLKSDVLPALPAKRFHRIRVALQPKQRELYEAALKDLISDLSRIDETAFRRNLTTYLARRSLLLQICSHPRSVVQGYNEVPAKLQALDSLLDDLLTTKKEKVVLWSFYTASIEAIVQRFSRFKPARYDGTVIEISERRNAVKKFQEDDETLLFIANPAAAGAGLTLHRARFAIYESMSNQAAHYLQSIDRIHRRGQTRETEYIILLCDGSLEITEYERLIQKEKASQELLGDRIRESPTRESMLDEFLCSLRALENTTKT